MMGEIIDFFRYRRRRPRTGDAVETVFGRAFVIGENGLSTCKGQRFFLLPEHIAVPEDGVA